MHCLDYKFRACTSLQKYQSRKPHTLWTAYLSHSLHSSTSTAFVSTCTPLEFMWLSTWRTIVFIINHTPAYQILLHVVHGLHLFSLLYLMQNSKLSYTCHLFRGNEVTCNSSNKIFILVKLPTVKQIYQCQNASVESATIAHTKTPKYCHCRQFWWN